MRSIIEEFARDLTERCDAVSVGEGPDNAGNRHGTRGRFQFLLFTPTGRGFLTRLPGKRRSSIGTLAGTSIMRLAFAALM